jgi:hypothetical protein
MSQKQRWAGREGRAQQASTRGLVSKGQWRIKGLRRCQEELFWVWPFVQSLFYKYLLGTHYMPSSSGEIVESQRKSLSS